METLKVDHGVADPDAVQRAARVLMGGGLVAARTDTVYGLLASVNRPDALDKLVRLKVRPPSKPFLLLASDWIGVRSVTSYLPPVARRLGARYWPGPITLVLPADEGLPKEVRAHGPTVAVRMPKDPFLLALLAEIRCALAAPSANRAGQPPSTTAAEVGAEFGDQIDLILDGGPTRNGLPSTIVLCTESGGEIVRAGSIMPTAAELSPS